MEKKEINAKVAVKGLVNGFIAYGFLISFIVVAIIIFITWGLNQFQDSINYDVLEFTLPIIASIIIFFLVRRVCQISSYDLFKKCKIKQDDVEKVSNKMNLFFVWCIIFCVIVVILLLTIKFNNEKINIYQTINNYSSFSDEYIEDLTVDLIYEFQVDKYIVSLQAIILEIGLLAGLLSLIPGQKKYIERYNYVEKEMDSTNKEPEKVEEN